MHEREKRIGRREALALIGATGAALAAACASDLPTSPTTISETATTGTAATPTAATSSGGVASGAACAVTPTETVGPYPSLIDLFRSDIREGKSGTQLDLALTIVDTATSCAPLAG